MDMLMSKALLIDLDNDEDDDGTKLFKQPCLARSQSEEHDFLEKVPYARQPFLSDQFKELFFDIKTSWPKFDMRNSETPGFWGDAVLEEAFCPKCDKVLRGADLLHTIGKVGSSRRLTHFIGARSEPSKELRACAADLHPLLVSLRWDFSEEDYLQYWFLPDVLITYPVGALWTKFYMTHSNDFEIDCMAATARSNGVIWAR